MTNELILVLMVLVGMLSLGTVLTYCFIVLKLISLIREFVAPTSSSGTIISALSPEAFSQMSLPKSYGASSSKNKERTEESKGSGNYI